MERAWSASGVNVVARAALVMAWVGSTWGVAVARAQDCSLREDQVLVVYDWRIPDSLLVAEHYAGSAKVPGGVGGKPGVRPGVRVVNLDNLLAPVAMTPDITYQQFKDSHRTPLRAWLVANDPRGQVRCIALTKGLPHRVRDTDNPTIGDDPLGFSSEFPGGDATCASLDAELALLHLNLDQGENGSRGDSFADGLIINPYHNQSLPINAWPTRQRRNNRSFDWVLVASQGTGVICRSRTVPTVQVFTPGDLYMVCRLDGPTVADVQAMIDRAAAGTPIDTDTAVVVLDESRSDGVANVGPNSELDNDDLSDGGAESYLRLGDDLERTREQFAADGRFAASGVVYNAGDGPSQFVVGPRINFGGGIVESGPVVLVASDGSNAQGGGPGTAGRQLPLSFSWGPMGCYTSVESFNARAFGGLDTRFGQSQIGEAVSVAGGATFAIGNAWEPFAFSIPDAEVIARNFYRGRLSWAEAAWSALPALSWQQVVVGDPLVRVIRTCEDVDGDGRWTVDDLYAFEGGSPAARSLDVNRSGMADDVDRRLVDPAPVLEGTIGMVGIQR